MPTGAEVMFSTAASGGVDVCFANPGTTEMPMVAALDRVKGMRAVLCLFEGLCSGAADGYQRVAGVPAMAMFHLGPGFANSLANQHNARRAHTPVLNLIGDQTRSHLAWDAPLTSDIEKLTRWAGWHRYVQSPNDIAADTVAAILAATSGGGGPASLVIPADVTWEQAPEDIPPLEFGRGSLVGPDRIDEAAAALMTPGAALILNGVDITADVAADAAGIAGATGCALFQYRTSTGDVGAGVARIADIPYFPEQAAAVLTDVTTAVLVGGPEPTTFFGYEDVPSRTLPPHARRLELATVSDDAATCLADLVAAVGGSQETWSAPSPVPEIPSGELTAMTLGQAVAALLPENAIVVQEGVTSSVGLRAFIGGALRHRSLSVVGGAIGGGLPLAVGAAIAGAGRPVVAFQADGSSMYTIQSLWTMVRESLDVTVVLCNNQRYAILQVELARAGIEVPGPIAESLTRLDDPAIDFRTVATGLGMQASRATTAAEFVSQMQIATSEPGPHLIEAML